MTNEGELPRHPRLSEKHNVALAEGSTEVLLSICVDLECKSVGELLRALAEREMRDLRPDDFARIKGVA
jgi:hypothetical protein